MCSIYSIRSSNPLVKPRISTLTIYLLPRLSWGDGRPKLDLSSSTVGCKREQQSKLYYGASPPVDNSLSHPAIHYFNFSTSCVRYFFIFIIVSASFFTSTSVSGLNLGSMWVAHRSWSSARSFSRSVPSFSISRPIII